MCQPWFGHCFTEPRIQGGNSEAAQEITAVIAQEVTLTSFFLMHDLLSMPFYQSIYLLDENPAAVVGFFDLNVGECETPVAVCPDSSFPSFSMYFLSYLFNFH